MSYVFRWGWGLMSAGLTLAKSFYSTPTDSMPGKEQEPEEMKAIDGRSGETPSREGADGATGLQNTFKRCRTIKVPGLQAAGG